MNIVSNMRRLIATSLMIVGFAAGSSHAQTPSVTTVNNVTCTSAHIVTVTYSAGRLNIQTGGCGVTVTTPPTSGLPVITLVSPTSGQVGTLVTITGIGLTGATVKIGGVAATVSATSATSITTTVPAGAPVTTGNGNAAGNLVVTTSGGAVSGTFAVTAVQIGADISIDGITLPNPSKIGFNTPPFRNGIKGAGPEINAYAMDPARCRTSPALTRSWQHNISLDNYKSTNAFDFFAMNTGESLSYKFTMIDADVSGGFVYGDAAASGADVRPTFMSITSAPCDFDLSKLRPETRDNCYQTAISSAQITWHNVASLPAGGACKLVKGQTYYLNLRFQDGRTAAESGPPFPQDSCNGGRLCGGVLQAL